MKKSIKFLALLCCLVFFVGIFGACTPEESFGGPGSPSISSGGSGGNEDSSGGGDGTVEDDPAERETYSYRPQITQEMPAVRINTLDGSNSFVTDYNRDNKLRDEIDYVDATISVDNCDSEYQLTDLKTEVKVRGNYTLNYEKKPIRIKLDKKNSMLGLHGGEKFKNWVLLADWKDLSMSNNTTAFYLGKTILGSDGYYSSDYRNVEVYINDQYWGVYLLVEQQEVKEGRTSTSEVPDEYGGTDVGYLVEMDGYYTDERNMPNGAGDPTFEISYNHNAPLRTLNGNTTYGAVNGYTVKSDIYSEDGLEEYNGLSSAKFPQLEFIQSYMENAYTIAYEAAYNDTFYRFNEDYSGLVAADDVYDTAEEAVSAAIDVQSLADIYILSEIACDPDISWSSFYMSVDMSAEGNKLLTFEAPWDFDSAFGIKNGFSSATGMYAANSSNPWFVLLIHEDWFMDIVREKWEKLCRYDVLKTALSLVEEQSTTYEAYYQSNFERWPNRLYGDGELTAQVNSFRTQGEAAEYLYGWLYLRFNYLNFQWGDGSDVLGGGTEDDQPVPEGAEPYKFEAEDGTFGGGLTAAAVRTGRDYASGGGYVGDLSGNPGWTLTYTVNAAEATEAYLFATVSKRAQNGDFCSWFTVTVNGKPISVPMQNRWVAGCAAGEEEWHTFVSVKLCMVSLQAGENVIVFTTGSDSTNFDCFELYSTVTLS